MADLSHSAAAEVLCIAGMHRSGTSLVASWLEQCGLVISDGRLHPATVGNERGHFEDVDFERLHRRVILRRYPASRGWVVPAGAELHLSRRDRLKARRLIRRRSRTYAVWGWKDPRTSLFLWDYRRLVPDLKVCAIWRPKEEVVDSLLRRASLTDNPHMLVSEAEAGVCWRLYNDRIDEYVGSTPSAIKVPLSQLLRDDRRVFDRVNELLGGRLSYVSLSEVYDAGLLKRAAD